MYKDIIMGFRDFEQKNSGSIRFLKKRKTLWQNGLRKQPSGHCRIMLQNDTETEKPFISKAGAGAFPKKRFRVEVKRKL